MTLDWEGFLSSTAVFFSCVSQVSLRVCRQRSGRPAALLTQFGGRAGGGRAAARQPSSHQCICHQPILRGRCPGPKVKTIHLCTALSSHPCTVTILFPRCFLVVSLLICLLKYSFVYIYISIYMYLYMYLYIYIDRYIDISFLILETTWAQQEMCLCACLFSQAVPQLLCTGCLCCPAANSPKQVT